MNILIHTWDLSKYRGSEFSVSYSITQKESPDEKRIYSSLKKSVNSTVKSSKTKKIIEDTNNSIASTNKCSICNNILKDNNYIKADKGKTLICKNCFNKLF